MKNPTFFVVFFLTFYLSQAQVGIGTTSPDPSSILDVQSTTQGMLAPRMSTAQRTGISNPAEGLLVYDLDQGSFYYYQAGTWDQLGNAEKRNNYVLVKTEADLPAPSGGVITLDENTLYEINGTVVVSTPVNLNGAYLIGLDTNEDVLARLGGTLFMGNKGGSIRNVTLSAPGGTIFDLDDTSNSETFVLQSSIVANSTSVGTIKGFSLLFFNIVQFAGNSDGITYENIDDILLNNLGWLSSNSGTYETFIGTFDLIEKVSGFSNVDLGDFGIDVSSNPTVNSGIILGTAFTGTSTTFVNRYTVGSFTGYSFTKKWFVNCPGIPLEADLSASGNFYFNGALTTGFTQTITNGTATEVQGNGSFTANSLFRFNAVGGGNGLQYDGVKQREFVINASLSVRVSNAPGNFYAFIVAKNGTLITESNAVVYIDNDSQIQNVALNASVSLAPGDVIEVYIQRLTGSGSDTLAVFSENLSIR
ncbi:cell wall anchor protein [Winogradskyella ursingii]|uniref:cell wall anchor protein n=1 Tax=Winogradskyella ursingii TaxID=2686079 RepID=UPI0015C9620F|nr:cell wall anchor protein [Winogradskyella ursingii]